MIERTVQGTTSAKAFIILFCIAEPLMDVVTGLWGIVDPLSFASANFPSLLQNPSAATSAGLIGMTRLAALMILVLGPLEYIALMHGSHALRVGFLAALLFGDLLHLGATALYESTAGGWSVTGISAMTLAALLASTRIFYLSSGRVPTHPRHDAATDDPRVADSSGAPT